MWTGATQRGADVTDSFYQLFFSSSYLDILGNQNQNFPRSFKAVFTWVLAQSYQRHKFETLFIVLVKWVFRKVDKSTKRMYIMKREECEWDKVYLFNVKINWMEWGNIAAVNFAGTRYIDRSWGKKPSTYGQNKNANCKHWILACMKF